MSEKADIAINANEIKGGRKVSVYRKAITIIESLNVRKQPDMQSEVAVVLKKGEMIEVFSASEGWAKIKLGDDFGYVVENYIKYSDESRTKGKVTLNNLNIRQYADLSSDIIGKLNLNEIVSIVERKGLFYKIEYKSMVGFVSHHYIQVPEKEKVVQNEVFYFYQRNDLMNSALEPTKKISPSSEPKSQSASVVWNKYGNLLQIISNELGIDVGAAVAVLCVESGGNGFSPNGKLLIRFENHVFNLFWGKTNSSEFQKSFRFNSETTWKDHQFRIPGDSNWIDVHANQENEWKAFEVAYKINRDAAMKSVSLGLPQVMGFNFAMIGYDEIGKMFENFKKDIRYHLFALFDFCKVKTKRIEYLKNLDFTAFANEYNGSKHPQVYGAKMKEFFDAFKSISKAV